MAGGFHLGWRNGLVDVRNSEVGWLGLGSRWQSLVVYIAFMGWPVHWPR